MSKQANRQSKGPVLYVFIPESFDSLWDVDEEEDKAVGAAAVLEGDIGDGLRLSTKLVRSAGKGAGFDPPAPAVF